MKQVAQENGINVTVLPPFTPPDCSYDKRCRMIQSKYANDCCRDSNCLIPVTDFFRNAPGINAFGIGEFIEYHARDGKAYNSAYKRNSIVPLFLFMALAGFLFIQQVYEFNLIDTADIPHSHQHKDGPKE